MRDLSLADPVWLWLLVPVGLLAVAYVVQQLRRGRYAVRFATLPMLDRLVPSQPRWRRHVPAALLLLTFVALTLAAAHPEHVVRVPRERATVVVAVDVSLSMKAVDVSPNRLEAARAAAKTFIEGLPDGFNVGVVEFAGSATVLDKPGPDHQDAIDALDRLQLAEGTAIGDGVLTSLAQIEALGDETGGSTDDNGNQQTPVPAHIVLLSDGTNTVGSSLETASSKARDDGVPVSTIAYGTPDGTVEVDGQIVPVPVDVEALEAFAHSTGGEGYQAETADQLRDVYQDIQSSIGYRDERRDATRYAVLIALALGMVGAAFSLRWFSRLP